MIRLKVRFSPAGEVEAAFTAEPEVFSPDGDGYNDFLLLKYRFEEPGHIATVIIFDAKGRPIRHLASSQSLGTEGQLLWDGTNDEDMLADVGIYIIFVETFNLNGEVRQQKLKTVLAKRF